jgi:hypothetical protein
MVLKSGESLSNPGSRPPCRDDNPWPQAEQNRKTRKHNQEETRDISRKENPGTSYLCLDQGKTLALSAP